MTSPVRLRYLLGVEEYPQLLRIWRSSVDATHDFLAPAHKEAIEQRLTSDYFPNVHLVVAERDGSAVGFAGTSGVNLEMLFVAAEQRGAGVGTALLNYARAERGITSVDVNEQNTAALGFYHHAGFVDVGRSPVDGDGLPYPLVHMSLAAQA